MNKYLELKTVCELLSLNEEVARRKLRTYPEKFKSVARKSGKDWRIKDCKEAEEAFLSPAY